jgi:membrane fusion protein (multidrug efflux system)
VEIELDAFPYHTFKGRVDSISPASGSQFALLPPDNATGNFTDQQAKPTPFMGGM